MAWREASKEDFFKSISTQNVSPRAVGSWPYTSLFKNTSGVVCGKSEDYLPAGSALPNTRYWLPA